MPFVDARACCDRDIPVLLQRCAREDERESESNAITDDEDHNCVHSVLEPPFDGELPIEQKQGELCQGHERDV